MTLLFLENSPANGFSSRPVTSKQHGTTSRDRQDRAMKGLTGDDQHEKLVPGGETKQPHPRFVDTAVSEQDRRPGSATPGTLPSHWQVRPASAGWTIFDRAAGLATTPACPKRAT